MKNSYYTNVQVFGSTILYRGIQDGRPVTRKYKYEPSLFVPDNSGNDPEYTTIYGEPLAKIKFESIKEARDFIKRHEGVHGFDTYGMTRYEYAFISDTFKGDIDWDVNDLRIFNIDIEVGSESGFPEPDRADEELQAITVEVSGKYHVWGCGEYKKHRDDVEYYKCDNEIDLIRKFLDFWSLSYPDAITGWNIKFFDIPYLVNRITKLMGENEASRLSPWKSLSSRKVAFNNKELNTYIISGISAMDYLEMYRRFAPEGKSQENYKLDTIASSEIGAKKLSYADYDNLHKLYKLNYQLFIEYNIRDVELVKLLDDKLKLIELVLTLAYDSKTNYDDTNAQVRMWDVLIFNKLRARKQVVPMSSHHRKDGRYEGAYVKEPQLGFVRYGASFDLDSLYPHLIMQYNISPEMLVDPRNWTREMAAANAKCSVDALLNREIDLAFLKNLKVTMAANGHFFKTDKPGFLPEMMFEMYEGRKAFKQKAIEAKKKLQVATSEDEKSRLKKEIARYNNLQLAKKVCLNSAYGALGNEFFRFFDLRQATAITFSGQLSIRWIEKAMNSWLNKMLSTTAVDYVIASDTDSIYVTFESLVEKTLLTKNPGATTEQIINFMDKVCEAKVKPFIDKTYAELADYMSAAEQKMRMKRETLFDIGLWTAAKRYILRVWDNEGVRYATPEIKVMGLEMVKSSTPAYCRGKLKESIKEIFDGDRNTIIDFIEATRSEFRALPVSDIAAPRGVNGLTKYADRNTIYTKGTPQHVRAALIYNHMLKTHKLEKSYESIKEGDKIKFVALKEPNPARSDVVAFLNTLPKEFDLADYIDYNTQFEKTFLEPLQIILEPIGWKTKKVNSLMGHLKSKSG